MNHNQPFVSIIVNCYNSDEYLSESLDSVFAQSFSNWEIVFWDNNSTDKSAEIAKSYGNKLNYYKSNKTTTLYEARNYALAHCNGEYIAFIDCDDIWIENKLEKQIELAMSGYDIVYGGYNSIDRDGRITSEWSNEFISGDLTNVLFRKNLISIGCALVKKSLLDKIKFDPYYDLLGDFDLWVRLSLENQIGALPLIVELSRQHSSNISIKLNGKWLTERRYFYCKHISFINFLKYPWLIYYILKTEILGLTGKR